MSGERQKSGLYKNTYYSSRNFKWEILEGAASPCPPPVSYGPGIKQHTFGLYIDLLQYCSFIVTIGLDRISKRLQIKYKNTEKILLIIYVIFGV